MIGTTRSRIEFIINEFEKLVFNAHNGGLPSTSLCSVLFRTMNEQRLWSRMDGVPDR